MNKWNLGKVRGEDGKAATIAIGTVRTGPAGSNASVKNVGDSLRAIFDFTIPRGENGGQGNEAYSAGSNVQISGGVISATDTTYAPATPSADGLMSKEDKVKLNGVATGATKNATDAQLRNRATHTGVQPISTISGLQTALDGKVDNTDSRLTNSREWTATTVSQAEAEAGTATTRRAWTAQRVRQAIAAWWDTIGTAFGKTLLGSTDSAAARDSLELGTSATSNVVQTTGQSTIDVMSQKAVTDAIEACCNGNGGNGGDGGDNGDGGIDNGGASLKSITWDMENDIYSGDWGVTSIHLAMKRCIVNEQAEVVYYLDPYDSTKKEDGTPAKLDGTDGDVMVEIPQVWYKTEFNGSIRTDAISDRPREGFTLHPRFRNGAVSKIYIGAYEASSNNNTAVVDFTNDKLASIAGKVPMVGLTRAQFRTLASNAGGTLEQFYEWQLLQLLFVIEYGNWNSQAVLAMGNVNGGIINPSGLSNTLGNQSGGLGESGATAFMSYRGIENLWGNCWTFIDGINYNDRVSYVNDGSAPFADNTTTGYTQLGSALPGGYIKSWQNLEGVFVPASTGGTSSTYIGDHLWINTGWRVAAVGGSAGYDLSAGLAACGSDIGAGSAGGDFGSRLSREKLT